MSRGYEQIYLTDSAGLRKVAVYLWRPTGPARGVVQIIHGMREHMGRYDDFASWLQRQGYAVCGHDHMGHGLSRETDGTFGYFGPEKGSLLLVRDCRRVTRLLQREYPEVPVFLLGHSMGSLIGRIYILHWSQELAGFLCMGTVGQNPLAPYGRALAEALVESQGDKAEGRLLHRLTFAGVNRRFSHEGSSSAWLSRDRGIAAAYDTDPLIHKYFTNGGFRDLYDLQMASTGPRWASLVDVTLPVLLLGGSDDPMGGYGKGPWETCESLRNCGVRDVELRLYPGARHELLNEINKREVFGDILHWMEQRLS